MKAHRLMVTNITTGLMTSDQLHLLIKTEAEMEEDPNPTPAMATSYMMLKELMAATVEEAVENGHSYKFELSETSIGFEVGFFLGLCLGISSTDDRFSVNGVSCSADRVEGEFYISSIKTIH